MIHAINDRRNIVLTGFIGTGKSTVGRILAERMGRPLIELDDLITGTAGKSRREIFDEGGEALFRALETNAVHEAAGRDSAVISCGGGAILDNGNVRALKRNGIVVLLTAPLDDLIERAARNPGRAIFRGQDVAVRVKELVAEREPLYRRAADITVDTAGLSPGETADTIIAMIARHRVS